jgi:hypothetical protein
MNIIMPSPNPQLVFNGFPNFKPFYTPEEILNMGVNGGSMQMAAINMKTFFDLIPMDKWGFPTPNSDRNFFKAIPTINIYYTVPPVIKRRFPDLGWLEWYIKFFYGARDVQTDIIMMGYWDVNIYGLTFYFRNAISYIPPAESDLTAFTDLSYLPEYRQTLLELGWDSTVDYNLQR